MEVIAPLLVGRAKAIDLVLVVRHLGQQLGVGLLAREEPVNDVLHV